MKKFKNLYLYESKGNAYSYTIFNEEQNEDEYGFPIREEENVTLQKFIGQLVMDGYPSNRLEFGFEPDSKERKTLPEKRKKDKQVDFARVKRTLDWFINEGYAVTRGERENIALFIELMSKSSSFAHKAHKELKRLKNL